MDQRSPSQPVVPVDLRVGLHGPQDEDHCRDDEDAFGEDCWEDDGPYPDRRYIHLDVYP